MPTLENGTLTYTSEQMSFKFTTDNYIFQGNKVIEGGVAKRIDGGFINRKSQDASTGMDIYVGNYSARIDTTAEGGETLKVALNDVPYDEFEAVYADLKDLLIATGFATA